MPPSTGVASRMRSTRCAPASVRMARHSKKNAPASTTRISHKLAAAYTIANSFHDVTEVHCLMAANKQVECRDNRQSGLQQRYELLVVDDKLLQLELAAYSWRAAPPSEHPTRPHRIHQH